MVYQRCDSDQSARASAASDPRVCLRGRAKDPAIGEKFANFYDVLGNSLAVGVGRPRLTNYGDVDRAIWVAVNDAARGAVTPEAALKAAAGQVRDLLAQAGYKAQ
jgi:multiple sugar transport system substrate-binding protein